MRGLTPEQVIQVERLIERAERNEGRWDVWPVWRYFTCGYAAPAAPTPPGLTAQQWAERCTREAAERSSAPNACPRCLGTGYGRRTGLRCADCAGTGAP